MQLLGSDPGPSTFYGLDLGARAGKQEKTHTHNAQCVQVYSHAGNLEVNQNSVFMAERTRREAPVSILKTPTR